MINKVVLDAVRANRPNFGGQTLASLSYFELAKRLECNIEMFKNVLRKRKAPIITDFPDYGSDIENRKSEDE
ncbi:hypothetical protein BpHYR1_012589 [Brachionus plicatilis]|uniref:Uncharacterized protein n=1 Tax=Brachionus plicatilis TaxID=10195 RepID=A0A3M7T2M4_BRAPC|nr:hypothetical protein BpHYR1_012589 [Brachionus plicatilis]